MGIFNKKDKDLNMNVDIFSNTELKRDTVEDDVEDKDKKRYREFIDKLCVIEVQFAGRNVWKLGLKREEYNRLLKALEEPTPKWNFEITFIFIDRVSMYSRDFNSKFVTEYWNLASINRINMNKNLNASKLLGEEFNN